MKRSSGLLLAGAMVCCACVCADGDWPAYQHDAHRSGVTGERVKPPLAEAWTYVAGHAPAPAWPPPAEADHWHRVAELHPRVTFDRSFQVAVAGGLVYFGSSADDKVYALDVETGAVKWTFFTGGPVRFAPTVADGKVYVGSDDGFVHCLDGETGALLWKFTPAEERRLIPGNRRLVSFCPVRTGLAVTNGTVCFAAGLFPDEGVYLCALDGATGAPKWVKKQDNLSPQGYILASDTRLYVPTGRATPAVFDLATGELLFELGGAGGSYAVLTGDMLAYGPGSKGELTLSDEGSREQVLTFEGSRMLVTADMSYLQTADGITALKRVEYLALSRQRKDLGERIDEGIKRLGEMDKQSAEYEKLNDEIMALKKESRTLKREMADCFLWEYGEVQPHASVLAGNMLYAGGDGTVTAIDVKKGEAVWTGETKGEAYGLAVAGKRLFVSTDEGVLHCFAAKARRGAAPAAPAPKGFSGDDSAALVAAGGADSRPDSGAAGIVFRVGV